mgnify:CR=1 FL=1
MSRVSSDEQAKGVSLGVQYEQLTNYCKRKDIEVVAHYKEDHSAKDFNRPEFQNFLRFAKKNKNTIDYLLVTSWDRFSRNVTDSFVMIRRLRTMGIEVQAIEQPIDFKVPESKAMLALNLVLPEIDNDRRSIKIRGGIRGSLKAGRWCRMAPMGYLNRRYDNNKPIKVTSVVISTQHSKDLNQEKVKDLVLPYIKKSIPDEYVKDLDSKEVYINPTGQFIIGGPDGDTGLTGRKIIVDTYGGAAPHGGGAFSGKDPTKVDRSAAYAARYLAKNIVSAGVSTKCLIQLAYAIGVSKPLSIFIKLAEGDENKVDSVKKIIDQNFNLSPRGIREMLKLNNPIYEITSAYGHFGRKPTDKGEFTWEKTDKANLFKL